MKRLLSSYAMMSGAAVLGIYTYLEGDFWPGHNTWTLIAVLCIFAFLIKPAVHR